MYSMPSGRRGNVHEHGSLHRRDPAGDLGEDDQLTRLVIPLLAPPDRELWTTEEVHAHVTDNYLPAHHVPRVGHTTIHCGELIVRVSTIFLSANSVDGHMSGTLIPWETMVFNGPTDLTVIRYPTPTLATLGHRATVNETLILLDLFGTPALATVTAQCEWWR